MRILVTGAAGQLGSDICLELERNADRFATTVIHGFSKNELDISDPHQVQEVFGKIKPDIVYNCAAYTDVDGCESRPDKAFLINGEAPGFLARECQKYGASLVHFSTDYIFNGEKNEPYCEDDLPDPLNAYGESKLMGEERIKAASGSYLIIRTSWLYGVKGKNFVETILRLAQNKPEVAPLTIVDDQIGSPTFTRDLASKTIEIASAGFENTTSTSLTGIFNITNAGFCTWFEFAQEILKLKGLNTIEILPVKTSDLGRPAIRPLYSVLSTQKLINSGFTPLRDWRSALAEYMRIRRLK